MTFYLILDRLSAASTTNANELQLTVLSRVITHRVTTNDLTIGAGQVAGLTNRKGETSCRVSLTPGAS